MKKYLLFFFSVFTFLFLSNNVLGFDCKLGEYTLTYDNTGKLVSATKSGNKISKSLESYPKPKSKDECPTTNNYKVSIIDGGRTLYVAKINETFGASSSSNNTGSTGCMSHTGTGAAVKSACENDSNFSCMWVENKFGSYCNFDNLVFVSCGDVMDIPYQVPELVSFFVNLLKIATPIILIIVSMITLLKAVAASKEDEIKKAQNSLVKKIITAVLIFFVISIVQFVILKAADDAEADSIANCMTCFLNNDCEGSAYYKNNVAGYEVIKYFNGNTIVNK